MNLKKQISNSIALALVGILVSTPMFNVVSAMDVEESYINVEDCIEIEDSTVYPDLILSDEEISMVNNYIDEQKNINGNFIQVRSVGVGVLSGWAGSFFIPGVGTAVITATGAIIVAGATIATASWVGKKVQDWVYNNKKKDAENAKSNIPSSLKKKNGDVNIDAFTDRVNINNKAALKNRKSGWTIQKDTAGHRGYDGSVKKWKIRDKKGNRIGSLNSNGKVIDK